MHLALLKTASCWFSPWFFLRVYGGEPGGSAADDRWSDIKPVLNRECLKGFDAVFTCSKQSSHGSVPGFIVPETLSSKIDEIHVCSLRIDHAMPEDCNV